MIEEEKKLIEDILKPIKIRGDSIKITVGDNKKMFELKFKDKEKCIRKVVRLIWEKHTQMQK